MLPFRREIVEAFDRVTAAATAAGVVEGKRTARIRDLEQRVDELVAAFDRGSPPVLRDDVLEAIGALERELLAEVKRLARRPRPAPARPSSAFDELFAGVE